MFLHTLFCRHTLIRHNFFQESPQHDSKYASFSWDFGVEGESNSWRSILTHDLRQSEDVLKKEKKDKTKAQMCLATGSLHRGGKFSWKINDGKNYQKGSISSTCLCAALTPADPESKKSCLSWLSFCAFRIFARKSCE